MSYIFLVFSGFLSFMKKNSKIIAVFLVTWASIVFIFSTNNVDLASYQNHYLYGGGILEPIYVKLEELFKSFGLNYTVLRGFLCFLGFFLITKTFFDLSPYPNICLFLYLLYPFCLDVVQVRFFVAYAIVTFSIRFILNFHKTHKKRNFLFFFIGIAAATGFHYSAVLFIVLSILFLNLKKRTYLIYFFVPVLIIFLLTQLPTFGGLVEAITGSERVSFWLYVKKDITILRIARLILTRGCFFLMLWTWTQTSESNDLLVNRNSGIIKKENILSENQILLLSYIYISLYTVLELTIAGDYERLNRVATVIGGILFTRQIYLANPRNKRSMWFISVLAYILLFLSVMFGMGNVDGRYINAVFRQVFENNPLY